MTAVIQCKPAMTSKNRVYVAAVKNFGKEALLTMIRPSSRSKQEVEPEISDKGDILEMEVDLSSRSQRIY